MELDDPESVIRNPQYEVRPEGLEPPAYWFEASRSIQLSYGRLSEEIILTAWAR
jgi:hypothetical protein